MSWGEVAVEVKQRQPPPFLSVLLSTQYGLGVARQEGMLGLPEQKWELQGKLL